MQRTGDSYSAAFTAAYPTVRRLVTASDPSVATALLDRRHDAVLAIDGVEARTAALAMLDAGRALVAVVTGDVEATGVHAGSAIALRRVLGPDVETDRWLLDIAALGTLGGLDQDVHDLRDRVTRSIDSWRRVVLDLLVDGQRDVARRGLDDRPHVRPALLQAATSISVLGLAADATSGPASLAV